MVLAGIRDEFDGHAFLAQGAIHLLRLAERVGSVVLALDQQEWRFGVAAPARGLCFHASFRCSHGLPKYQRSYHDHTRSRIR